jgi:hypothetical protein
MDILLAVLFLAVAVWFVVRLVRGLWPKRFGSRANSMFGGRATMKAVCPVCRDRLNTAEINAIRDGRRKCSQGAKCPYGRSRFLN